MDAEEKRVEEDEYGIGLQRLHCGFEKYEKQQEPNEYDCRDGDEQILGQIIFREVVGADDVAFKQLVLWERVVDGEQFERVARKDGWTYQEYGADGVNGIDDNVETENHQTQRAQSLKIFQLVKPLQRIVEYEIQNNEEGEEIPIGMAIIEDKDAIISRLKEIKNILFNFTCDNAEEFREQIDEIDSKESLYELRNALSDAKALMNQVRSFGDAELKQRFEAMQVNSVPSLISEVTHRIQRINLLESTDHKADVSGIIREALAMMEFEFRCRGTEELEIVYNDLRERYERVEQEFASNIDNEAEDFILLSEAFRQYFAKRGFTPDTVAAARDDIGYMDAVMKKIKAINTANKVLQSKYNNDEKFVRLHKRIREENLRRDGVTPPERPLISREDIEIARALGAIKQGVDEQVYNDWHKVLNEGYFDQMVMQNLAVQLTSLKVAADRPDRLWLQNRLATEYREGYDGQMNP